MAKRTRKGDALLSGPFVCPSCGKLSIITMIEPLSVKTMRAVLKACRAMDRIDRGGQIPWMHNAGITQDIEKLRAICLAFSRVWNDLMVPALTVVAKEETEA